MAGTCRRCWQQRHPPRRPRLPPSPLRARLDPSCTLPPFFAAVWEMSVAPGRSTAMCATDSYIYIYIYIYIIIYYHILSYIYRRRLLPSPLRARLDHSCTLPPPFHSKLAEVSCGKGNSNSPGAMPVHLIITMLKWIRTSRLSIKSSLSGLLPSPVRARLDPSCTRPPLLLRILKYTR